MGAIAYGPIESYNLASKNQLPKLNVGTIGVQYATTTAIASSVTETSLWNESSTSFIGTRTLPAGTLQNGFYIYSTPLVSVQPGAAIRVKLFGTIGNTGTPDITIKAALNTQAGVQKLLSSTTNKAMSTITGVGYWELDYVTIVEAYSATVGIVNTVGNFKYSTATTGAFTSISLPFTSLTSLDTTVAYVVDTTITWGTSSSSNTITTRGGTIEILA